LASRRVFRWALSRLAFALALCLVAGLVACLFPAPRERVLRAAGALLVAGDPEQSADAIVLAVDAGGAGALEAADLVHRGMAQRVAVFAQSPGRVGAEFARRGVPWRDEADETLSELRALGVNATERIPDTVEGTGDEGRVLPRWCAQNALHSIIFVSNRDHSRRTRRLLRRAMADSPTRVTVLFSPYSNFDPDHWWESRTGVRSEVVELQKLLLDLLAHPLG
jgi:hypothetical protein